MKSRHHSFNLYFALVCLVLTGGCGTFSSKKEQSTIRLYLEGQKADKTTSGTVLVTSNKFPYTVQRDSFLDEGDLSKASIVNDPSGDGGYSIQLKFNDHGSLLLDMNTADNMGRHIIVFSQFPTPGLKAKKAKHKKPGDTTEDDDLLETRPNLPADNASEGLPPGTPRQSGWLAAVLIRSHITDGIFRFTPDASRKEGFRIVRGLRNVITKENKGEK